MASVAGGEAGAGTRARDLRWLRWLLLALAIAVWVGIALTSPGYDDEAYNIATVGRSRSLLALIGSIERSDVHPPGQYVVNALLHAVLRSWPQVRAAGALVCAAMVFRYAGLERFTRTAPMLLHFLLVALHPTLLMWCTGLRWTSYFVPLFLAAVLWTRRDADPRWRFWPVLALIVLAMLLTNYLAIVLGPLVVATALYRRRDRLRGEWPAILVSGLGAAPLALVQFYCLARFQMVHLHEQTAGPAGALAGVVQGLAINFGVFPVSITGIATFAAFGALVGLLAWRRRERLMHDPEAWLAFAGVLLVLLCGLSGKGRNLTPLVPLVFVQFVPLAERASSRVAWGLAAVLAASNLIGGVNVARHWDTNKGSWNLPVRDAITATKHAMDECRAGRPVVVVFDPILSLGLSAQTGYTIVSPRTMAAAMATLVPGDYCLIQLKTYHGAIPALAYARYEGAFPAGTTVARIGPDPRAGIKRRIDPATPDFYVEVVSYGHVRQVPDLFGLERRRVRAHTRIVLD